MSNDEVRRDCLRAPLAGTCEQPVRYTIFSEYGRAPDYDRDAVALNDLAPEDDDDWFGEGSVFDSGEELAEALLTLAGSAAPVVAPAAPVAVAEPPRVPLTWTVRSPGSVPLPPRQPGRGGWSIRSSVQVLRRTEEVLQNLREEAVAASLDAAARAIRLAG